MPIHFMGEGDYRDAADAVIHEHDSFSLLSIVLV